MIDFRLHCREFFPQQLICKQCRFFVNSFCLFSQQFHDVCIDIYLVFSSFQLYVNININEGIKIFCRIMGIPKFSCFLIRRELIGNRINFFSFFFIVPSFSAFRKWAFDVRTYSTYSMSISCFCWIFPTNWSFQTVQRILMRDLSTTFRYGKPWFNLGNGIYY